MIIDFDKIDASVFPAFKGGEKEFSANMFFDGTNRIFKGRLIPGSSIGIHTHDDSCEVIFIIEGNGIQEKQAFMDGMKGLMLGDKPGDLIEDYLPVIAFAASDSSKFITGQTICVDGGTMMVR